MVLYFRKSSFFDAAKSFALISSNNPVSLEECV